MIRSSLFLIILLPVSIVLHAQGTWGTLANQDFDGQAVKSVFFYAGNWRNGVQFYDYNPTDNTGLYTLHPSDARHLGWSENPANRDFALNEMIALGFNVINMSYWGVPGTDNWTFWAPMQTSTAAHDELFNAALDKDILIAPYIESFAATDDYPGYSFMSDFPGSVNNPAPHLITMLEDLIDRYLINPAHPEWPEKWARIYDQNGTERYLFSIIHVASDQTGLSQTEMAEGFDRVADSVFEDTGIHIGFALDALPSDPSYAPGQVKPNPEEIGTALAAQSSVLAIQSFIPEIWLGMSNEDTLLAWKEGFISRWMNTGIPVILDVSSGYDASIVFPASPVYGNNNTWREGQEQMHNRLQPDGITFNVWNGYTEGLVAVPSLEYGSATRAWICYLIGDGICATGPSMAILPQHDEWISACFFRETDRSVHIECKTVSGVVQVSLLDMSGQLIDETIASVVPGISNTITLQPDGPMPLGIYLIRVISGKRVATRVIYFHR